MNVINLDAYREQKARKRPPSLGPAYMMCWVMFVPMPMMVPRRAAALGA